MNNNKEQIVKNIDMIHIKEIRESLCFGVLIDLAEENGIIRKSISDLDQEFSSRNIFKGKQSKIFVHKILNSLEEKKLIIKKQRCKPEAGLQICGKHFYYQINFKQNKETLIQFLDQIPKISALWDLQIKVLGFSEQGETEK